MGDLRWFKTASSQLVSSAVLILLLEIQDHFVLQIIIKCNTIYIIYLIHFRAEEHGK